MILRSCKRFLHICISIAVSAVGVMCLLFVLYMAAMVVKFISI